jgi:protein SMG6
MVFTNVQLDDFAGTLAHFLGRLEMEGEGIEERKWVMMGVVNLGALLDYGRLQTSPRFWRSQGGDEFQQRQY